MGILDFFKSKRKSKESIEILPHISEPQTGFIGVRDTPLDEKYTPDEISMLGRREIFVFGYGIRGHHLGSDARTAIHRFGGVMGGTDGLHGNSYAIPIGYSIEDIRPYVDKFIEFAEYEKALTFYITKIGCDIAGFEIQEIAPLFRNAYYLPNIVLPIEFAVYIENENRSIHPQRILDTMEAAHEKRVNHFDTPIKIIGVGGGCNAVSRMIENPSALAEYAILSNDMYNLRTSNVSYRYQLQDTDSCTVKSICSTTLFNRYYANKSENINLVNSILDNTVKHLIIVAGFGGGVGTYGSEWIAALAKKAHIPVTVVCTIPFDFEGKRKQERALDAAHVLLEEGIDVIILSSENLKQKYADISFFDCFSLLDEYVAETVDNLCKELAVSCDMIERNTCPNITKLPYEVTTHCYGMTRTFADIVLSLNEEKQYTSPNDVISDLGAYMRRFAERGDNVAFLSVHILKCLLNDEPEIFRGGVLNPDLLRELMFRDKYIHSKIDKA